MVGTLTAHNSPFNEEQIAALRAGFGALDAAQAAWLSGFLAGRLAESGAAAGAAPVEADCRTAFDIVYASETGNGRGVAESLARSAAERGLSVSVRSMDGLRPAGLRKLSRAVFVVSTHGEGDPPEDAVELFECLGDGAGPRLDQLEFRVLSLGDSSYAEFCAAGRRFEQLLIGLGARPFAERIDCDVDFEAPAAAWSDEVLAYVEAQASRDEPVAERRATSSAPRLHLVAGSTAWSRQQPFGATVQRVQEITGRESTRDVRHIELSLDGSGIRYAPGDSLGVWAPNSEETVAAVLDGLRIEPTATVEMDGRRLPVSEWLRRHRELTRLAEPTLRAYAEHAVGPDLRDLLASLDALGRRTFIEERQFLDVVEEFRARLEPSALVKLLRPLSPRSYSIASAQPAVGEEAHLAVATVRSGSQGRRVGVASGHLNLELRPGDEVGVFLEPNERFRLPADPETAVILVGAGTGIAPYRAFLQQWEEEGRAADSWLFFGNRHQRSDFLYQRDFLRWRAEGVLSRIDAAWSREGEGKRYVQHLIRERADEIAPWLERGAVVFVCGARDMGQGVERALEEAVAPRLGHHGEQARAWLAELRRDRRLLKDLY